MITVLDDPRLRNIAMSGDRICAVYATPADADVAVAFHQAARAHTLTRLINNALHRRGRDRIEVGFGLHHGRLLSVNTVPGRSSPRATDPSYLGEAITLPSSWPAHVEPDRRSRR